MFCEQVAFIRFQIYSVNSNDTNYTESYLALNFPAKYKFYTKYELSYWERSKDVTGLKISLKVCRTRRLCH